MKKDEQREHATEIIMSHFKNVVELGDSLGIARTIIVTENFDLALRSLIAIAHRFDTPKEELEKTLKNKIERLIEDRYSEKENKNVHSAESI